MTCSWAAGDAGCSRLLLWHGVMQLMQLSACIMGQWPQGVWHAAWGLRTLRAWRGVGKARWGFGYESERGRTRPDRTVLTTLFGWEWNEGHIGHKPGTLSPSSAPGDPKGNWKSDPLPTSTPSVPHSPVSLSQTVSFPHPSRPPRGSGGRGSSLRFESHPSSLVTLLQPHGLTWVGGVIANKKAEAKGPEDGLSWTWSQGAGAERPLSHRVREGQGTGAVRGLGVQIPPLTKGLRVLLGPGRGGRFLSGWQ